MRIEHGDSAHSGGLLVFGRAALAVRAAEIPPMHIGPQLLAAHSPSGGAFDDRAVLCGHLPPPGAPLIDHAERHVAHLRQLRLRANDFHGFLDGIGCHARNYSAAIATVQATLQRISDSVAI